MEKNGVRTFSNIPYAKLDCRWIRDLNIGPEIIKFLEENIERTLFNINCSSSFLDQSPKAKDIKAKINKWDLVKFKSICVSKESINKTKSLLNGRKYLLII